MNIEIVGVAYAPSQGTAQESTNTQNNTKSGSKVDEAADVVAQNSLKAREQARQEADFAAFSGTVDAHELNMERVMDLLNDPALADL